MISNLAPSAIRTFAGYAVAWLLSLKFAGPVLDAFGVDSATAKERLTAAFVVALGTAYYLLVRVLEKRWPQLGVFLGVAKQPVYVTSAVTTLKADPPIPDDGKPHFPAEGSTTMQSSDPQ